jgi:hypothetical protein
VVQQGNGRLQTGQSKKWMSNSSGCQKLNQKANSRTSADQAKGSAACWEAFASSKSTFYTGKQTKARGTAYGDEKGWSTQPGHLRRETPHNASRLLYRILPSRSIALSNQTRMRAPKDIVLLDLQTCHQGLQRQEAQSSPSQTRENANAM